MEIMRFRDESLVHFRISRRLLDGNLHPGNLGSSAFSRPRITMSFPLGTILVLVFIITIAGLFSCCCYYWNQMRRIRRSVFLQRNSITLASVPQALPLAGNDTSVCSTKNPSLPVVMPGDNIPKFIAWPCPYTSNALKLSEEASSNELLTSDTPQQKPS